MAQQKPRKYTAQERREAITLAGEIGANEAARRLGIPRGSVSVWCFKAKTAREKGTEWPPRPAPTADDEGIAAAEQTADSKPEAVASKPARVARQYTPSQRAQALELAEVKGITAASKELGISRFAIYAWRRKVALAAKGEGDCPTSGPEPAEVEARRDEEIVSTWREHPGLGPSQVRNQLRRKGVVVSINTTRRVMEDAGYRPPKVTRTGHDKRFEAIRPNHMWHMDFVQRWINRTSTFTLILIDDYSRFVVGHGVDDAERAALVVDVFEQATTQHGRPEKVMHDKGSAFWSWRGISRFTRLLEEMGVDQVVAQEKEWNGKVEAFNGNLHKELFDVHRFYDLAEMKRRLQAHLHWYNHRRTHHALGGLLVPADRYYGRVQEVMARIEAGAGADASDMLQLRDRMLELFKVTSTGGKAEVWLMGQRLL